MNRNYKRKILYAPLFAGMLLAGGNTAFSAGTKSDYLNKINELEARISSLETLKKELQELKKNLNKKTEKVVAKEDKLDKAIRSLNKRTSVREASPDSKWAVTGYASASFEAVSGQTTDSFGLGSYSPIFHYRFKDWIMFEAELEAVTNDFGETEIDLEYAQINLMLSDNATLVVGKFLSPIGAFQERLHPAWINKSVDRPAGLSHHGVAPGSDMGVMIRGGVPVSNDLTFQYSFAVGNGPQFDPGPQTDTDFDPAVESEIALEGFGADNDKNKSLAGRVSLLHKSSVEIGFSYETASISGPEVTDATMTRVADYRLWGADASYTKGPWDVRFEYMHSRATPTAGIDMRERTFEAWYTQAAYRMSGVTEDPILGKFEPVVRYGEYRARIGGALMGVSEKRWNGGVNYWLAPSIVVKAHVERRNYFLASTPDETRYQLQFAYGF